MNRDQLVNLLTDYLTDGLRNRLSQKNAVLSHYMHLKPINHVSESTLHQHLCGVISACRLGKGLGCLASLGKMTIFTNYFTFFILAVVYRLQVNAKGIFTI